MSPLLDAAARPGLGFPRTRGDEPELFAATGATSEFSPHARG